MEILIMDNRKQSASRNADRLYVADHLSVSEQCIRERAYEIYRQRGCKGGHADGDWLTAEAELKELRKKAADMLSAVESLTNK